jgi:hypothetical protein
MVPESIAVSRAEVAIEHLGFGASGIPPGSLTWDAGAAGCLLMDRPVRLITGSGEPVAQAHRDRLEDQ